MALYQNKPFQKGHGLFSTEEIPVLDPSPKDLLDLLSCPPLAALSLLPSFWAPPYQPHPSEPSPATTKGRTNYQEGSTNPTGKVFPWRQVPSGEGGPIQGYIPFTTSDLCNRKIHSKGLREDPEGFLTLLRGLFQTHVSTKADTQSLQKLLQMGE